MLPAKGTLAYLVHTDVAFVTEHHVVALFTVGGAAHVADDIFIILYPQTLHCLNGMVYVVMAMPLQSLYGAFHCQLIYRLLPLEREKQKTTLVRLLICPKHKMLPSSFEARCLISNFTVQ